MTRPRAYKGVGREKCQETKTDLTVIYQAVSDIILHVHQRSLQNKLDTLTMMRDLGHHIVHK